VFFVDMWFEHSAPVLGRLGLTTVPALFHWGPAQNGKPGKKIPLPKEAQVCVGGWGRCVVGARLRGAGG
jgi:hypothetical protein